MIKVEGKTYNNHRYSDDTALLTGNEKELSVLTSKIYVFGKQFGIGMKIIKKTKARVVRKKPTSPKINIAIDRQHIEQVTSYRSILGT